MPLKQEDGPAELPPMTQPEAKAWVREVGTALFGHHWVFSMAEATGINYRELQRWASKGRAAPSAAACRWIFDTIQPVIQERLEGLQRLQVLVQTGRFPK